MNLPRHTAKRRNRPAVEEPPGRRGRGQRRLGPVEWSLLAVIAVAIAVTAVMAIVNPS